MSKKTKTMNHDLSIPFSVHVDGIDRKGVLFLRRTSGKDTCSTTGLIITDQEYGGFDLEGYVIEGKTTAAMFISVDEIGQIGRATDEMMELFAYGTSGRMTIRVEGSLSTIFFRDYRSDTIRLVTDEDGEYSRIIQRFADSHVDDLHLNGATIGHMFTAIHHRDGTGIHGIDEQSAADATVARATA